MNALSVRVTEGVPINNTLSHRQKHGGGRGDESTGNRIHFRQQCTPLPLFTAHIAENTCGRRCCEDCALEYVPQFPQSSSVAARERSDTKVKIEDICDEVKTAKKVMLEQLINRVFTNEPTKPETTSDLWSMQAARETERDR